MGDSLRDRRAPSLPPDLTVDAADLRHASLAREGSGITPALDAGSVLGLAGRSGCGLRESGPPTSLPSFPRTLGPHRALPAGGEYLMVPRRRP